MNLVELLHIPERTTTPRQHGLTMVMDKGLSIGEAENMISVAGQYIDLVKLGFGTAYVTPNLDKKIKMYKDAGVPVYFGGTLFEAFLIRGQFEDYINAAKHFGLQHVEVSDGSITIDHAEKCTYIERLA